MESLRNLEAGPHLIPRPIFKYECGCSPSKQRRFLEKHIQPKIAAISSAVGSKDSTQIAQSFATHQPEILSWMIDNDVPIPTQQYLDASGLKQTDELLVSSSVAVKDPSPTKTPEDPLNMRSGICGIKSLVIHKPKRTQMGANVLHTSLSPACDLTACRVSSGRSCQMDAGAYFTADYDAAKDPTR